MGLCLGFSALSGVEVIYFLTLRNLWERKRKQSIKSRVAQQLIHNRKRGRQLSKFQSAMKSISRLRGHGKAYHDGLEGLRDNAFMVRPSSRMLNTVQQLQYTPTHTNDLSVIDLLSTKNVCDANNYYNNNVWKSEFD